MSVVDVDVNIHELRQALAKFAPDLEKELRDTFKKYATDGRNLVKTGAPVRTGNLQRSIGKATKFTKTQTRLQVVSASGKGVPKYRWPQDVGRHSGSSAMTGTHYIGRAADQLVPRAVEAILKDLDRLIAEFNS